MSISASAQEALTLDIFNRRQIEACGVLLGKIDEAGNWQVENALPLRNISNSAVYFEFDPLELLTVELEHPGEIVGVYHSHPGGYPKPSSTDQQNMKRVNIEQRIPWAWLIVPGPFRASSALLQKQPGALPTVTILAYHHFLQEGLCSISIRTSS